jgi:hypothetical protein
MVRILIGLLAACLVAALVIVLHAIAPDDFTTLSGVALTAKMARLAELTALTATLQSIFVLPLALIGIVVCEVHRVRSPGVYGVLGLVIAAAGFWLQYAGESDAATIVNPYAAWAYAIEGVAGGLAYWLLAGRYAGWRRGGGLVVAKPFPIGKPRLPISDVTDADPERLVATGKR